MEFLLLILAGMISGISSSAPIGPANLWVANAILSPQKRHIISFSFGIIVIDIVYAFIAFTGYFVILKGSHIEFAMGLFSSIGLAALGLYELLSLKKEVKTKASHPNKKQLDAIDKPNPYTGYTAFRDFTIGMFLCGANPVFILFWVFVAKLIHTYGYEQINVYNSFLVYLGIALGDVLWYSFFAMIVKKGRRFFSVRFLTYLRFAISFGLIIFGVVAFFKTI